MRIWDSRLLTLGTLGAFLFVGKGAFAAGFSFPREFRESGTHRGQATVEGQTRSWTVITPTKQAPKSGFPMILLLHGFSGNAAAILAYTGFRRVAEREGIVLLAPEGTGRPSGWNTEFLNLGRTGVNDFEFLVPLTRAAIRDLQIDRQRVFVVGHSNGGMMANALIGRAPELFAGVGAMAGLVGAGRTEFRWMTAPSRRVNVIHIHGTGDSIVGYQPSDRALVVGPSAPDGLKWLAQKMGIRAEPKVTQQSKAQVMTIKDSRTTLQLWTLPDWRHEWPIGPSAPIQATETIWTFFNSVSRPARD